LYSVLFSFWHIDTKRFLSALKIEINVFLLFFCFFRVFFVFFNSKFVNMPEQIENPSHYGGKNNPHEVIKFINAHELNFNLGNVVKYIVRAGKKDPNAFVQDLKKARFYLNHEIEKHEKK